MNTAFLSGRTYTILFALLGLVYICGLFVPLMNNDSAHHAGIALHMYLTGDYVSLIDHTGNYLDKPHLLFWLSAFSYHLFGVTGFAYKFPSFLFTMLGTYSTYRLGKKLYTKEIGKLAALVIATGFAYILSNNDVRMEAILTACIAFSTWQLVEFIDTKKILAVAGSALGLALGFSTKGHIAIFIPAIAILFYILYRKNWSIFFNWKWLLLALLFALLIFPVVCCYYLQYNLHPEIVVRGKDHLDGVAFILWNQSIERFSGGMGQDAKNDYLFFIHSFIWAFAPWSIITYIAFVRRLSSFFKRRDEWLTTGCFGAGLIVISLSGFKLPHYINIIFPVAAVMTASFIISIVDNRKWVNRLFVLQLIVSGILLLFIVALNTWAFPITKLWLIILTFLLAILLYYIIQSLTRTKREKLVVIPAAAMIFFFFMLNTNFYPQLLKYQGGNELARITQGKISPGDIYFWKDYYSPSFLFYTASLKKGFTDSVFRQKKNVWVLADESQLKEIKQQGYQLGTQYTKRDYRITKLKWSFIDPATRERECTHMILVNITGKN